MEHNDWPDKSMFAGLLLMVAGGLGLAFGLLKPEINFGSCADGNCVAMPAFLTSYPWAIESLLSACAAGLGLASLRLRQAWYAIAGAVCAVASLGLMGIESVFGLVAAAMLVMAWREGEHTPRGGRHLASSKWPDKALAASLLLFVAALLAASWGVLILVGRMQPLWAGSMAWLEGGFGVIAAVVGIGAAFEVYHQRKAWLGYVAAGLLVATFGLFIVVPFLAVIAVLLLRRAKTEEEFGPTARAAATPSAGTVKSR